MEPTITFGRSYLYNGTAYATLEKAQEAAVVALFDTDSDLGAAVVAKKAELVAILTLTDASRPKARGVRKPRKAKGAATSELPLAP